MKKYEYKPYNPSSPSLFEREKDRLAQFLTGNYQIEHIGSTAIPDLGGKGIIDIMIAVPKDQMANVSQEVQKRGYIFRSLASTEDRLFLRTEYPEDFTAKAVYHLHITYPDSRDWKETIALRDYLRTHPDELAEYAEVKKKAADEANEDMKKYKSIKKPILDKITSRALKSTV